MISLWFGLKNPQIYAHIRTDDWQDTCMSELGLLKQKTIDGVVCTVDLSRRSGDWEVQDQGAGQFSFRERACFLAGRRPPSPRSSHGRQQASSHVSLIRTLILLDQGSTLMTSLSRKYFHGGSVSQYCPFGAGGFSIGTFRL